MPPSLARLRPVHVAALSLAYWIGLAAVKLGGALLAIARVALPGMHGSVGLELKNLMAFHLTVTSSSGSVIWGGYLASGGGGLDRGAAADPGDQRPVGTGARRR